MKNVMKNYSPTAINRVVLLTDGMANDGITETAALCQIVKSYADKGVYLTTFGMGREYDERFADGNGRSRTW